MVEMIEGNVLENGPQPEFRLSQRVLDCLLPVEPLDTWKWCSDHAVTKKGMAFNFADYPWVKGIAEAWDNPNVERIFVMAGSRLGKTENGLCFMQSAQEHDPDVGMIVGPTQTVIEDTIGDRFWKMMEKCLKTRKLCPPPSRRTKHKVKTRTFTIYGAWSGSPTTLGDKDPRYMALMEVDKYTKNASEEADPFFLAMERGREIPDRKLYAESTPTVKGKSRIAKHVYAATNRRFHCPCPHCGHYQELVWNEGKDRSDGGLWWDRDADGVSTPTIASKTAVYVCESCNKDISEEHRRPMIRQGVWCAEGQRVDNDGTLVGTPVNDGPDESFHYSRLYGPTFSFSYCAREYVASRGEPEAERSFDNNVKGVPWEPLTVTMRWQDLAERLCVGNWDVGTVPDGCYFLTTAVDVQLNHFVIATFGWNREKTAHLIQHGTVFDWAGVFNWISTKWQHADGHPIQSAVNLIDSKDGNRKDEVFDYCKAFNGQGSFVWPLAGANYGQMNVQMFRKQNIDTQYRIGQAARKDGLIEDLYLITVNTTMTQNWIDNAMVNRKPGMPSSIVLPESIQGDQDLFDQLLNEQYDPIDGIHKRVDETTIPVDFRDTFRYNRVAAEVSTGGNWDRIPPRRTFRQPTKTDVVKHQQVVAESQAARQDAGKSFIRRGRRSSFGRGRRR